MADDFFAANAVINAWIQGSLQSRAMTLFMEASSFLADVRFLLIGLPFVYWFTKYKRFCLLLLVSLALAGFANTVLKEFFQMPRPFLFTDTVVNLSTSGHKSYSFPSGHSQLAATLYTLIFLYTSRNLFKGLALLAIFLVGFSRVYLGVHYPIDVLVGWSIGAATSFLIYEWLFKSTSPVLEKRLGFIALLNGVVLLAAYIGLAHTFDFYRSAGFMMGVLLTVYLLFRKESSLQFRLVQSAWDKYLIPVAVIASYALIIGLYRLAKVLPEYPSLTVFAYALLPIWIGIGFPNLWKFLRNKRSLSSA